jgi:hypothetical protein
MKMNLKLIWHNSNPRLSTRASQLNNESLLQNHLLVQGPSIFLIDQTWGLFNATIFLITDSAVLKATSWQ